ncbi:MAG: tRNA (cytidine(34)-2'-O)-methyltransferase [Erysipelotrichales bacterium]|nr:tRNA (cytidine(34)-2'-O)-methyltransferase [Erysipelotrichales bacterium]
MLHLVVYQPEIPQNTGNMMRTCVATGTVLHLIEPLGFKVDDKSLKRAGMDYIDRLTWYVHKDWNEFMEKNNNPKNIYFLTRYGEVPPSHFDYSNIEEDYYFVVGKESTGIDKDILKDHLDHCMRLPMTKESRSLNVSNTAAIIIYEALRQQNYASLAFEEYLKGPNVLKGE